MIFKTPNLNYKCIIQILLKAYPCKNICQYGTFLFIRYCCFSTVAYFLAYHYIKWSIYVFQVYFRVSFESILVNICILDLLKFYNIKLSLPLSRTSKAIIGTYLPLFLLWRASPALATPRNLMASKSSNRFSKIIALVQCRSSWAQFLRTLTTSHFSETIHWVEFSVLSI